MHPAVLTPVDAATGAPGTDQRLDPSETLHWQPDASPEGPLTLAVSAADRRVVVLRNGKEIGRARIDIKDPGRPLGTHAYTVLAGGNGGSPRWHAIGLPGHARESKGMLDKDALDRIRMPKALTHQLFPLLKPGTTMLVTDAPILEHTTGPSLYVMRSGLPEEEPAQRHRGASVKRTMIN